MFMDLSIVASAIGRPLLGTTLAPSPDTRPDLVLSWGSLNPNVRGVSPLPLGSADEGITGDCLSGQL